MKKFLTLIFLFAFIFQANGQKKVSFQVKPLSDYGYTLYMIMSNDEKGYYILAEMQSVDLQVSSEPTLMLKTRNEEIIKLEGELISTKQRQIGVMVGNMYIPATSSRPQIKFPLNKETINKLPEITKAKLTTIPSTPDKEFSKNSVWVKLYKEYEKIERINF